MPVTITENWSQIAGQVLSVSAAKDVLGFAAVHMHVGSVHPVEGYADLLEAAVGEDIDVLFPDELVSAHGISEGDVLTCRVRRAGVDRIFAHREHVHVLR